MIVMISSGMPSPACPEMRLVEHLAHTNLMHSSPRTKLRSRAVKIPTGRGAFGCGPAWIAVTLLCILTANSVATLTAADSRENFIIGLLDQQYFDTALEYLDALAEDKRLPHTWRAELDLQRGLVWQAHAAAAHRTDDREKSSLRAQESFRRFLAQHPAHDLAPYASLQAGNLLFSRAQTRLWQQGAPSDADQRQQVAAQVRQLFREAATEFEESRRKYEQQLNSALRAQQSESDDSVEENRTRQARLLSAWLRVVDCTYHEALTWERDDNQRYDLLTQAADQYEVIYNFSRTSAAAAGWRARLMMGKCLAEQDNISAALGFFNEVADQSAKATSGSFMQRLSHLAIYYRLNCLNHESRGDHQLVITEGDRWLVNNRREQLTKAGLGILFEKARAEEALATNPDLTSDQRQLLLRQALADAEQVSRVAGPVQQQARQIAQQLRKKVDQKTTDPRDFESVFEKAREIVAQLQLLRQQQAPTDSSEGLQRANQELALLETEAGRLFVLALKLRKADSDRSAVAQARYLLSYVYLRQGRYWDAFTLSRHTMKNHTKDTRSTAENAAEIAVSAANNLLRLAPQNDREFESELLREICEQTLELFPESSGAAEARLQLGQFYQRQGRPLKAATVFLAVDEQNSGYPAARIAAGQAYWRAWAAAVDSSVAMQRESPDRSSIQEWKQRAEELLEEGIQLSRLGTDNRTLAEIVVQAEVSLCNILNMDGRFEETIERLTEGTPSVVDAVDADSGQSPGNRMRALAGSCYQVLLRAYIGTQHIDEARSIMQTLRTIGAKNNTAVYTQLGREIQQELRRLKAGGETDELQDVQELFVQFLDQIYQSRDESDLRSLLWIADSWSGLRKTAADSSLADDALRRAATVYQEILSSGAADEAGQLSVQLQLIRVWRQLGEFEQAVRRAEEVLEKKPHAVNVQIEAAGALADWGETSDPDKFLESIQGWPADQTEKTIWGWTGLARRLEHSRTSSTWKSLRESFLNVRYELARSRYRYALQQPDRGQRQLEAAAAEITMLAQVSNDLDDAWWSRFEGLYKDIQVQLGNKSANLPRPTAVEQPLDMALTDPTDDNALGPDAATQVRPAETTSIPDSSASSGQPELAMLLTVLAALGATVGGAAWLIARRPRQHIARTYSVTPSTLRLPTDQDPPRRTAKQATAQRSSAAATEPTRSAAARPAETTSPARRRPAQSSGPAEKIASFKTGRVRKKRPPKES